MSNILKVLISVCLYALSISLPAQTPEQTVSIDSLQAYILTPTPALLPRINGAKVFGVHPKAPFIYQIPASGKRPMQFNVAYLAKGFTVNNITGLITGAIANVGEYHVTTFVKRDVGKAEKKFKIIAIENTILTPAFGRNSLNCWVTAVCQEKKRKVACAMVSSILSEHRLVTLGLIKTENIANWAKLSIKGKQIVLDIWRQQKIGFFDGEFAA